MKKTTVFALIVFGMAVANVALADMEWVYVDDPGVSGHEGFTGYMSKYETTNAQYCEFLNAAIASGDITVDGDNVLGASGSNSGADFVGQLYYNLAGPGATFFGATHGGAARINYSGGVFSVDNGFENHPVTYVSWYGAAAFCNYYGYRLPTEWEWQAVADYDGSYIYGCGTSIDNSMANYYCSTHPNGTTEVGAFGAYGYGLCDMAGNVWEWTSSTCGGPGCRIDRGGCWSNIPGDYRGGSLEVWYRYEFNLDWPAAYGDGFRVAFVPEPAIEALVDINPDSLNKNSKGQWVTVYITLPAGYDVSKIDPNTISITSLAGATCNPDYHQAADLSFAPQVGDRDEDGIPDLTVKFNRQELIANLCLDDVAITVEGKLLSGKHFKGSDRIRVIDRGK